MDQKQSDALHEAWLLKEKKKKQYIKIAIISVVVLVFLFVAFILFYNFLNILAKNKLPAKNATPTTVYDGMKMQDKCLAKFQDFLKNYGADYSKCLGAFDFNVQFCSGFNPETNGLSNINIIVILDASGSMAETIYSSQPKIDIAKKAVTDFLTQMPSGVNTGLVVYGDKGSNLFADKTLSCNGIEEVIKLGQNNSSNIISAVNSFSPKGWTPIAGSINFVKNIFLKTGHPDDKNYVVLVSDGVESCDGDPLSAADNLKLDVPNTKLDVIGLTNDSATQNSLQQIAGFGNGSYLTASNSLEISKAFNKELLAIKKDCVTSTLFKISSGYATSNLNNLNCWLAAQKKESDDFTKNVINVSSDQECNSEMAAALSARQNQSWGDKEALNVTEDATYKKVQADLNNQLNILNNQQY